MGFEPTTSWPPVYCFSTSFTCSYDITPQKSSSLDQSYGLWFVRRKHNNFIKFLSTGVLYMYRGPVRSNKRLKTSSRASTDTGKLLLKYF